jgi:hypothetical protein
VYSLGRDMVQKIKFSAIDTRITEDNTIGACGSRIQDMIE